MSLALCPHGVPFPDLIGKVSLISCPYWGLQRCFCQQLPLGLELDRQQTAPTDGGKWFWGLLKCEGSFQTVYKFPWMNSVTFVTK